KILLIDDVFTTGSTVRECARVLLANGAEDVAVLTLARALYHKH
ncbi:MAG: ComF family protein, partial [Deltaproteobacteria bacterium]|nr:ComF family protein [Deltaproteobacteria bacterium]